ncbi:hypothetical protein [Vibrio sp. 03_296]|uniref:LpxL/LpxP family acyltransferase n=1 Tax=Vibrio sp. 03_296 TaxID=2024409 RepID=UPI002D8022E6|nr:hypothetical protein [Vibrio sp. 03_296]
MFRCLETAGIYLLTFASLTTRSKKWLTRNTNIKGMEHLQTVLDRKSNVILMVPHTWTIDIPAIVLASRGLLSWFSNLKKCTNRLANASPKSAIWWKNI